MKIELLKDKKVLVLGLGREGESSFKFLRRQFPDKIIGLADQLTLRKLPVSAQKLIKNNKRAKLHLGKNYLQSIKDYDILIKSPGISRELILPHIKNQKITSQTEIFLGKHRGQTIGVTGTKGKGTTAGLIYKIFKGAGFKVRLIGNMGKPALDYFGTSADFFVFEISSHQLENLRISPHISVFVNIYLDHLDYFGNFEHYFKAKTNITKWQKTNDYFIFNNAFSELRKLAKRSRAKTVSFSKPNNYFLEDVMAASAVASIFKIPFQKIKKSIKDFQNAEHRLELVGQFKGIKFYNDSASTIPQATLAALNAFKNIDTLILGGSEKGSDFRPLAKEIIEKKIKTVVLFPITGKKIWQEIFEQASLLKKKKLPQCFFANNMKQAVSFCFENTKEGGVCLLSPASASFTTFKNYQDRGKQFKKQVRQLARPRSKK